MLSFVDGSSQQLCLSLYNYFVFIHNQFTNTFYANCYLTSYLTDEYNFFHFLLRTTVSSKCVYINYQCPTHSSNMPCLGVLTLLSHKTVS